MRVLVTIWGLVLILCSSSALASGGGVVLQEAPVDLGDRASLQRGAKLFVNYCLSCHSASFMRYNRMARDIGITDEQLADNLLFAGEKVGDKMQVAMRPDDATAWFGNAPPDLSVISRARGADWLYTYLLAFYSDEKRPFGVNNLLFPDVAMPHVLATLQGVAGLKKGPEKGEHGHGPRRISQMLEIQKAGTMNPAQYRRTARDLVNFLVYLGEPAKLVRYRLGWWVLAFLLVFFLVSRALYKEYWKDIH